MEYTFTLLRSRSGHLFPRDRAKLDWIREKPTTRRRPPLFTWNNFSPFSIFANVILFFLAKRKGGGREKYGDHRANHRARLEFYRLIDRVSERWFIAPRPTISRMRYRRGHLALRHCSPVSSRKNNEEEQERNRISCVPLTRKSIGLETVGRSGELYPRKVSFRGKRWQRRPSDSVISSSAPVCVNSSAAK